MSGLPLCALVVAVVLFANDAEQWNQVVAWLDRKDNTPPLEYEEPKDLALTPFAAWDGKAEVKPEREVKTPTYTPQEIAAVYADSPFAGDDLFKDKNLTVTGEVFDVRQDWLPDAGELIEVNYIVIATPVRNRPSPTINCVLKPGVAVQLSLRT